MEIFLGFIIILIIMLCLGVSPGIIAAVAAGAVGLAVLLILVFFLYSAVLLAMSEKAEAVFTRAEKNSRGFESAYYSIDGEEYPNAFPKEVTMHKLIYRTDRTVKVRVLRKKKLVFDTNAQVTTVIGLIFFAAVTAAAVCFLFNYGII